MLQNDDITPPKYAQSIWKLKENIIYPTLGHIKMIINIFLTIKFKLLTS